MSDDQKTQQRKKERSQDNYEKMEAIRGRLGMTKDDFSVALGYVTGGGYSASTKNGVATLQLLLAAEGVERRYGKGGTAAGPIIYTLLAVHPGGRIESIPIGGAPQTMTLNGRDFIMVPKKGGTT